jgi:hypothetical protein
MFLGQRKSASSICDGFVQSVGNLVVTSLSSWFSRLDYCNALLAGLPAVTLAPLQQVLHAAARLVNDLRPHNHVTQALKDLHWLPIVQRIEYKLCLLVHN